MSSGETAAEGPLREPRGAPGPPAWRRHLNPRSGGAGNALLTRIALAVALFAIVGVVFAVAKGGQPVIQASLDGLVTGSYLALGAVGLSFVYGILRLINFAHGDFLTFGAYATLLMNVGIGVPLIPSILFGLAMTAALSVALERVLWRPLRARGAAGLQLILTTIGLAFLIRYTIQFIAGPEIHTLNVDITTGVNFLGARIGRTILISSIVAYAVLLATSLALRYTSLGKQLRALADNLDLAETTGFDTRRLIMIAWAVGGGLAGLAGAMYVLSTGAFNPQFGFMLLLPLFAAVLVGGVGNPYGAIVGGIVLGVTQEWSTLFVGGEWKPVVVFGVLIVTLIFRPNGVFGSAGRV